MKKQCLYFIFYILLYCLFFCGCDKNGREVQYLSFINNTNKKLETDISFIFPDTLTIANTGGWVIPPNSKRNMTYWWESEIKESTQGIVMLFVYDWDALKADTLNNYKVTQRYDLSLSDLDRLGWTITYPPTEAMKDVKMWPTYGTTKSKTNCK